MFGTRGDGHHYDVTSNCCGVIITISLVEWTLNFFEKNVIFCSLEELLGLYKYKVWHKSKTTWAGGIVQLTHHKVCGWGKNPSTFGLRIFAPTVNLVASSILWFFMPLRTSWWVHSQDILSHCEPRSELIVQYCPPMLVRYTCIPQAQDKLSPTTGRINIKDRARQMMIFMCI